MRRVEPIPYVCSDRNDEWSTFSAQRKIWSNSERTFQTSSIEAEIVTETDFFDITGSIVGGFPAM